MRDRRLVAFFVAFWVMQTVAHAGYMTDPDKDEILIDVGEPTFDLSSGFVDFQLALHFGDRWWGQSLSFVGINVEQAQINGHLLGAGSVHFSRFRFVPTPDSDIQAWGISSQRFGDATTPGLEEWIADPANDPLPKVIGEMSIGTLRFDFGSTEPSGQIGTIWPTSIDSLTVDLRGGMHSSSGSNGTTSVVGLLDTTDANTPFQYINTEMNDDLPIAHFEGGRSNQVVPEPSAGVTIALAIATALAPFRYRLNEDGLIVRGGSASWRGSR